jgi:hypothetical protein
LLDQEKTYLSKEYKLLKKNKVDTAEFDGFEKDKNAGEITFTEATEDQKKERVALIALRILVWTFMGLDCPSFKSKRII